MSRHWASWKKRFCRSEKGLLSIGNSPTDPEMITCALRYYLLLRCVLPGVMQNISAGLVASSATSMRSDHTA
jgi:hypothetical protein